MLTVWTRGAITVVILCQVFETSLGQFFGVASCAARCNSTFSLLDVVQQNCRCDAGCTTTSSCCGDYDDYCVPSCRRRCGQIYHPLLACQCHDNCQEKCCGDYEDFCVHGSTPTRSPVTRTRSTTTRPTTTKPTSRGYSYLSGREILCPDGVPFVDCYINPCETPCPKYPGATCFVQECGSCEAKLFDTWGNQLDCYEPEKFCSNGQPIFECGDVDLCKSATCPGFPNAICVPNRCGGCHYDFVDDKGNIIECNEEVETFTCPPGLQPRKCSPLPCSQETCVAHPSATCRNVVCAECRAEFVDDSGNVVDCNAIEPPPCKEQQTCAGDPCKNLECPAYFDAECRADPCNECKPSFYKGVTRLRDLDCVIPNSCIDEKTSTCHRDPCLMYTCAKKEVVCVAQYCDGCSALFFDMEGKRLTEEECKVPSVSSVGSAAETLCPEGNVPAICDDRACDSARCEGFPDAFCGTDICNDCRPIFFDTSGNRVKCKETA